MIYNYHSEILNQGPQSLEHFHPLIYVLSGLTFCMGFFSLIAFFYNKRYEFLWYSLYLLFITLYFFFFPIYLGDGVQGYSSSIEVSFRDFMEVTINIFYTLFVAYYINLNKNHRNAFKIAKIIINIHVVMAIYYLLSIWFYNNEVTEFVRLFRVFGFTVAYITLMLYIIFKYKNLLIYITLLGSFVLTIGVILFRITGSSSTLIVFIGLELIIFGLGLLYKVRLIDLERNKIKVEAEINKRKALRAQINPHFIFNALSSIQSFVLSNNSKATLRYLGKFGRLTRNILESSIETHVVLEDEIKMLHDYLELESLRFEDRFQYEINIDEDIDTNMIEIPFMILQPFVENAILHGLLPKEKGERLLQINFKKETGNIVCEIDDNGVGRQLSKVREGNNNIKKVSRGLDITKQRLESFTSNAQPIKIIDKVDSNKNPLGTTVNIFIN